MFNVDCSTSIQNDRYKGISYPWIEVNSRDWNSMLVKVWYQEIQMEQYREGKKGKNIKTKFKLHRSLIQRNINGFPSRKTD